MYELNINHLNVNGFMDVHTIDVPITGDSLEITDKEHALFRVSRMNKVCSKTGVQALGPSSTFQVINDKTFTCRLDAEEALTQDFMVSSDVVYAVVVTPESAQPYVLYAAYVYNPQKVAANRAKANMPFTAKITFENYAATEKTVNEKNIQEALSLLSVNREISSRFEGDTFCMFCEPREASDLFNAVSNLISRMRLNLTGTQFDGVTAAVRYV
ncbi:hypothetical protein R7D97_16750 [Vibrio sp. Vb5031]|uniref:Uncharacterized protein n=2 Tax=Vibrio TaxID=662 RepID=A0A0M0HXU1_9VIBR|nr:MULTISPECIES: hypothetical protein [Vibrio]KOO06894.1 hypothetical protein AKJ31_14405 [Vibrio hepatarius]MCA2420828.1 hypothetical protein [Vibrio alginolyticus]MCA2445602.1 hypothetical protein [Vibrio alginolyticus]MCR9821650.1 hypothetical protein [Vibrio parahaemolyticus]MDF5108507.1 hypothetical protein [Vibrio parahaemolyticus]